MSGNLDLQIKVSKLLSLGFVFSIVWLAGIGSLIALFLGVKSLKIINQSHGEISGTKLAWWCIVVGGFGVISSPFVLLYGT